MARALIIEDDDALREELVDLLEGWGFAVTSVASGRGARALGGTFDIILCDYKLEHENGLDVLRSLPVMANATAVRPRAYLMTGHLDLTAASRHEIATLGLGLLLKPVSARMLQQLMAGETV
jgi:CheY-like chemotaxis protein